MCAITTLGSVARVQSLSPIRIADTVPVPRKAQRICRHVVSADRNRFEFRWVGGVYSVRYRNRVTLLRTFPLARPQSITPHIDYEIYYTFEAQAITKTQARIGAAWRISGHVAIDGAFVHQVDRSSSLNDVNAIEVKAALEE